MGHIALNEEQPAFPLIELAQPRTTLAAIAAEQDEGIKAELMAQRQLEEKANDAVFQQKNDYWDKQIEVRKWDMGKLCGIIKARISDAVQVKLEEDPKFNEYQLGDPVKLLQKIKNICMTYKGDRYSAELDKTVGQHYPRIQRINQESYGTGESKTRDPKKQPQ